MLILLIFAALYILPFLVGIAWAYCVTTPRERALIRNFDFFLPPGPPPPYCPRCGSDRVRQAGGFCRAKAVAGVLLTGSPLGANAGLLGLQPGVYVCENCGCRFSPSKDVEPAFCPRAS